MTRLPAALVSCFIALPLAASAENNPWDLPWSLGIGLFGADASTSVRLDSNDGRLGTQLSFEGDLGGQRRKTLPIFDAAYRFNSRHAIEGSVVSLHRDGEATLAGNVNWGDQTFPVNTRINSDFNSDIVRVAYRYSPWHDDRMEVGFLFGLHYTNLETSITSASGSISQEASVKYPLPTLGARGSVRIADSWRLAGFGQILKLKIGDYDGELYNFAGGLEWAFTNEMIAGLGYEYYRYSLASSKDRARGEFEYRFDGPKVYFSWNFR